MEKRESGRFDELEKAIDTCSKLDRPEKLKIKDWLEKEILRELATEKAA